jgi:hypothetical protein
MADVNNKGMTNCAPWFDMDRNTRSPLMSMNVTSSRFTVQLRPGAVRCALFRVASAH